MANSSTRCWDCGSRLWFEDEQVHPDIAIAEHRGNDCARLVSRNYYSPAVSLEKTDGEERNLKRKKKK